MLSVGEHYNRPEELRFSNFIGDLVPLYLACNQPADEQLFRRHYGDRGSAAFWEIYLHELKSLPSFTQTMPKLAATRWADIDILRVHYECAMLNAFNAGEPFLKGSLSQLTDVKHFREIKKPESVQVVVKDAVLWLAANPWKKHLLPPTLQSFLSGVSVQSKPAKKDTPPVKNPRGPKREVRNRVKEKMLSDLRTGRTRPEILRTDTEVNLEQTYGASRHTCRIARSEALSVFVGVSHSDK